MTIKK